MITSVRPIWISRRTMYESIEWLVLPARLGELGYFLAPDQLGLEEPPVCARLFYVLMVQGTVFINRVAFRVHTRLLAPHDVPVNNRRGVWGVEEQVRNVRGDCIEDFVADTLL